MMKKYLIPFVVLLMFQLDGFSQNPKAPEWIIDSISADPAIDDRFTEQSFAMDSENTYHFVFERWDHDGVNENGGFILYYMFKPCNEPWSEPERIHTLGESNVSPTITVTPDDRVFICYQRYMPADYWSDAIYVAEKTEEGWVREQIPTPTDRENWMPQMTSDAEGHLHITWVSGDPENPNEERFSGKKDKEAKGSYITAYATNKSGEWVTQLIDKIPLGNFGLGARPFVKVTPEGVAHLVLRGRDNESDPGFPRYRVYYATNLVPGGTTWETEMLESERQYDEVAYLALEADKVHVAIGGSNAWEQPNFTYYTVKENGKWSELIRVNNLDYGYPTQLAIDNKGDVHITYISTVGQGFAGELIHWKKSGEDIQEISIVSDQGLAANDFLFDNHQNTLVPYLTWEFQMDSYLQFLHDTLTESTSEHDILSNNPSVVSADNFLHVIAERTSQASNNLELVHVYRQLNQPEWAQAEVITTPGDNYIIPNSTNIAANADFENPALYMSYMEQEVVKNKISDLYNVVLGEYGETGWSFSEIPFSFEGIQVEKNFLAVDYEGKIHAAVYGIELNKTESPAVIKYATREDDAWQIQTIYPEGISGELKMEIAATGMAYFIFTSGIDRADQINIMYNLGFADTSWQTQSFATGKIVDTFATSNQEQYIFLTLQTREIPEGPSAIEHITIVNLTEALESVLVSPEGTSSWELHEMNSIWGGVVVSFSEASEDGTATPLKVSTMSSDFASFIPFEFPQTNVHNSFPMLDEDSRIHVIIEEGEAENHNISALLIENVVDIEVESKLLLMRSGECSDNTSAEPIISELDFAVYPNPAKDKLNVSLDFAKSGIIEIYDISGRLCFQKQINETENVLEINLNGWEKGLYLLNINSSEGKSSSKFLIQ